MKDTKQLPLRGSAPFLGNVIYQAAFISDRE